MSFNGGRRTIYCGWCGKVHYEDSAILSDHSDKLADMSDRQVPMPSAKLADIPLRSYQKLVSALLGRTELASHPDLKQTFESVWAKLDGRGTPWFSTKELRVISLRFGLEDDRSRSLKEIGEMAEFGCTRERIRQIEAKALRKMRHPSRLRPITDLLGIKRVVQD